MKTQEQHENLVLERDVRGGGGERQIFRDVVNYLKSTTHKRLSLTLT